MPAPRIAQTPRRRSAVASRLASELRAARAVAGLTQRQVARGAGLSQSTVARCERGTRLVSLVMLARVADAVGHDLVIRLYPNSRVPLRDSGQLAIAEQIRTMLNARWRIALEVAVGPPPERRAADMVLTLPDELLHVEIESALLDLQAQLRAAQQKRAALASGVMVPVHLVLALADTDRNRAAWRQHLRLVTDALPASSRSVRASLRSGRPLGVDGLLWVRSSRTAGAVSGATGLRSVGAPGEPA